MVGKAVTILTVRSHHISGEKELWKVSHWHLHPGNACETFDYYSLGRTSHMATHNHNEGWRDEEGDNPTMYREERETRKIWETYP